MRKKWLGIGLSVALMAGLFYYVGPNIEGATVARSLAALSPWMVALAVVTLWANFAVSTERYRLILSNISPLKPCFIPLYRLTFLSLFSAHLVALGPAADVVRIAYGRLKFQIPTVTAIESVIYDRVLAMVGLAVIGMLMLLMQTVQAIPHFLLVSQLLLWLGGLCGIVGILWVSRMPLLLRNKFSSHFAHSISGFPSSITGQGQLLKQFALAFGYSGTYGLTIWILAKGMGFDCELLDVLQFSPLILFVQNVPVFYMGWGARETVLVGTLGQTGILSGEEALAVSIATGLILFIASLPGAFAWLMSSSLVSEKNDIK
jgi:uncharacterized membrane protein YbhN (UPF0104 family)